jgi:hypothetical protein
MSDSLSRVRPGCKCVVGRCLHLMHEIGMDATAGAVSPAQYSPACKLAA